MVTVKISDIINLNGLSSTKISLSKALLLFYLGVACNFTGGLFSKKLRKYFDDSRIAKHIIGFIMMLVLIIMIGGVNDPHVALGYSTVAYLWFIFTTKLDLFWNLMIICALVVGFLYESQLDSKNSELEKDEAVTDDILFKIQTKHLDTKTYIGIAIALITVVGVGMYVERKNVQYGGGSFDPIKFLLY